MGHGGGGQHGALPTDCLQRPLLRRMAEAILPLRRTVNPVFCALSASAAARAAPWAGGRGGGILPREAPAGSGRLRTRLPCHTLPGAAR